MIKIKHSWLLIARYGELKVSAKIRVCYYCKATIKMHVQLDIKPDFMKVWRFLEIL